MLIKCNIKVYYSDSSQHSTSHLNPVTEKSLLIYLKAQKVEVKA